MAAASILVLLAAEILITVGAWMSLGAGPALGILGGTLFIIGLFLGNQ